MLRNEKGISILEELISLALIALVLIIFVGGLSVGSAGVGTVYKRVSSENLARAGLEHIKNVPYLESGDYVDDITSVTVPVPGYSLMVEAQTLVEEGDPDTLQLITITVRSGEQTQFVMEGYKRGP